MFEDVMVQWSPAAPFHSEHSLVIWRSLVRSECAETEATKARASSAVVVLNFMLLSPHVLTRQGGENWIRRMASRRSSRDRATPSQPPTHASPFRLRFS